MSRIIPEFGTLQAVDLRTCWADEAHNFTPWLATTPDALHLLGQAIGLELAIEATEVPVGPFNADILARDLASNTRVVIENQLERTDHDHFGKILTYAAVLGASVVVWIARTFTEQHQKAVDWLNELTKGDLLIYGIELQVWRIGASAPAPRFEVICSPNEIVREAAFAVDTELSDTRKLQLDFWTEVRKWLENTGKFSSLKTPQGQYWFEIAIGRSHMHISLTANTFDGKVAVKLYLGHRVANQVLAHLEVEKSEIMKEIGCPIDWNPHPEKRDKILQVTKDGDISDRESWPVLAQWLASTAVSFKQVFAPRIARMDLSFPSERVEE